LARPIVDRYYSHGRLLSVFHTSSVGRYRVTVLWWPSAVSKNSPVLLGSWGCSSQSSSCTLLTTTRFRRRVVEDRSVLCACVVGTCRDEGLSLSLSDLCFSNRCSGIALSARLVRRARIFVTNVPGRGFRGIPVPGGLAEASTEQQAPWHPRRAACNKIPPQDNVTM
jgi:hypothetical protein